MTVAVFDIEADGLNPTKIHCLSVKQDKSPIKSTHVYSHMRKFFTKADVLVGHNITRYDIPVVEKLLDIEVKAKIVDTLAISWYLYPNRIMHGLADWGEEFGIPKPKIDDWEGLTTEEYIHRCSEDVKINKRLWDKMWRDLNKLYDSEEEVWRLIDYLQFKMDCAREQERLRWKLDVPLCTKNMEELKGFEQDKIKELAEAMPKVIKMKQKSRPAKPFKRDGTPSVVGQAWFDLLLSKGLPEDYDGTVDVVASQDEPNPNSTKQVKDWLYSLGWKPQTFKYKRDKVTNELTKIPQINLEHGKGICPSIKLLYAKEPKLEALDGLSVLTHRISILKGFLDNVDEDGYVQARVQGFTNTLRFKHRVVVNLPGVDKPYGTYIRGCLTCPEGYVLVGSDMSSLEDRTKQHYMHKYDPEYVKEMNTEGFDPHLDIAEEAGMMTSKQVAEFKAGDKSLNHVRHNAKQVNYSCTYGVTPAGLVRNTGMKLYEAEVLHKTYWKRNWSLNAIADACVVKNCMGTKWLYNPVSGFWYSLRHDKDRFSTLNQGTGVYCFDRWVEGIREKKLPIVGQMHDEIIGLIRDTDSVKNRALKLLKDSVAKVNKELKLNRDLDCDVQFGYNYGDIH